MRGAARWLRTVRHLRAAQVGHRIHFALRRRAWERMSPRVEARYRARAAALGPARLDHPGLAAVARYRVARVPEEDRLRVARDALAGRFTFLGRTEELGCEVAWHRPDLDSGTRLWKTRLHEFPYAIDLAVAARVTGHGSYRARLLELMASWEAVSPIGRRGFAIDCWNGRAVATRLANLAVTGSLLADDRLAATLGPLLARHALFLRENLELDLGANHLIRDAAGLVFANELFGGFADGLTLLRDQIEEQILPDGGHFERTPLYHAIVLEDLLELRLLLGRSAPAWLSDAVLRMGGFLETLLHGDGDLPLLGDTWLGEVEPARLLREVRALPEAAPGLPRPQGTERASGIVVLTRGDRKLVLRAGPHGPAWQLGHAHGDLLSFELSRGAMRLVTDTGTVSYDAGPARQHLRSSAAHNTIEIDGESQIEAWGSFRVGRRGRAWTVDRGEDGPWSFVSAAHDAFAWLAGQPTHHRLIALSERALLVLDAVVGEGPHRIASRLHLAPDLPAGCVTVAALRGEVRRAPAPWHPRWGETLEATRLSTDERAVLPWVGGWILRLDGASAPPVETSWERCEGGVRVRLRETDLGLEIDWIAATKQTDGVHLQALPGAD